MQIVKRKYETLHSAQDDKGAFCQALNLSSAEGGGRAVLIPNSNYKTIFVILSVAKNLSLVTAEILHEAQLRSE